MKKIKVGTILEKDLLGEAKKIALNDHKRFSEVLEEALKEYVAKKRRKQHGGASWVRESAGLIPASPELVKYVMEETESTLDS